jgi:hypothetical protein
VARKYGADPDEEAEFERLEAEVRRVLSAYRISIF